MKLAEVNAKLAMAEEAAKQLKRDQVKWKELAVKSTEQTLEMHEKVLTMERQSKVKGSTSTTKATKKPTNTKPTTNKNRTTNNTNPTSKPNPKKKPKTPKQPIFDLPELLLDHAST